MPITVVGSIAYDTVTTPFGERERMLGGAAVHFALAASFFDEVRVVGPVGEDFGEAELDVMRHRGVDVSDVERVPGGKTFFWRGKYGWDLNSRETLDTQLGVFEGFTAEALRELARQRGAVPRQHPARPAARGARAVPDARFVGAGLDEPVDRSRARLAREGDRGVDCLILNDSELRQLTGKPSLSAAAREVLSWSPPQPRVIVAKQGEYGAALITGDGFFSLPAFPLETVMDPTGAGDTFAGGLRRLHRGAPRRGASPTSCCASAMAYGTALASFNVEEFGTERVARLTGAEIVARVAELREITQFSAAPLPLGRLRPPARSAGLTEPDADRGLEIRTCPGAERVVRSDVAWMPGPSSG